MRRIGLLQLVVACALLAAFTAASAADPRATPTAPTALKHAKLASRLAAVARLAQTDGATRALAAARDAGNDVFLGGVAVEVESTTQASTRAALAAVSRAGGRVVHRFGRRATALVPPAELERIAAARAVRAVRERSRPFPDALRGEGVAATGAPAWHAAGWTGAGVKIGVIDGGFAGYRQRQASGDLPDSLQLGDFCQLGGFEGIDHGTAVAEIVHEMAPGAQLYLICIDDGVALGDAVTWARAMGIRIVNHSAAWFNTWRGDGTGPRETPEGVAAIAQAAGMLWVNSAGNYARAHWAGRFADAGSGLHQFAPGDIGNSFVLDPEEEACVFLKWDDWPVTAQDFDLFVHREIGNIPIAAAIGDQSGQQEPYEQACFSFDGTAPEPFSIRIQRKSGSGEPRLDLFVPGRRLERQTPAGSIGEPASSPATMAVGAVCWQTAALEPYSSQGPTVDGRKKPELAGPDSVSSATYGRFAACGEHVGFPGTSASSPHVVGAAALVAQARPHWTAAQLRVFLLQRTADIGVRGNDNQTGAGRLLLGRPLKRAPKIVRLVEPQLLAVPSIQGPVSPGRKVTGIAGRWRGTAPMRYRYTWLRCTMDGGRCAKLGKNGQSYVVGAADGDYTIRVAVTATNAAGSRTALSRATEPVPGGYSIEPADALVLYSFAVTPAPRAGGTLVANLRVVHVDGTPVLGAAVRCNAAAGGRKLAQSGRLFSNGFARCTWRVPALAARARIAGALTVVVSGQAARRTFTVYVA